MKRRSRRPIKKSSPNKRQYNLDITCHDVASKQKRQPHTHNIQDIPSRIHYNTDRLKKQHNQTSGQNEAFK